MRVVIAEDQVLLRDGLPRLFTDSGPEAAHEIKREHPGVGVLVLSQHIETRHIVELVASGGGFGYLLKDRVLDVDDFLDAARRVASGGAALAPTAFRYWS